MTKRQGDKVTKRKPVEELARPLDVEQTTGDVSTTLDMTKRGGEWATRRLAIK